LEREKNKMKLGQKKLEKRQILVEEGELDKKKSFE
jgi:hypothetical protein